MCRRPLWLRVRDLESLKSFVRICWTDSDVTSYLILAAEGIVSKDSNQSLMCLSMLAKARSETVKERKDKNSTTSSSEEKRSPEPLASVVEVRDFALMAV